MHFLNVIKPTHICNLSCKYCFNDDIRDPIMREPVLERVVEQTFAYTRENSKSFPSVEFLWHGGEPMVPGRKFYEKVVAAQHQHSSGMRCVNSIQTNGLLIDKEWAKFFVDNDFNVSVSIDGPQALHDKFRVDHRGRGSYDRVVRGINIARDAGIKVGVCVVISRANAAHAQEIYDFLVAEKLPFNVIPLNRSGAARENYQDVGLEAEEYAKPWIEMYDRWFDSAGDQYTYVMDFVLRTRAIVYGMASDCVGMSRCANSNISVDPMGDVYACGSVSGHDDTKYGNLMQSSLADLMKSRAASEFRNREVDPQCSECKWQHVCHGGCPARSYKFFHDVNKRDYYCPSLFAMYEHVEKRLADKGIQAGKPHPLHMTDGIPNATIDGDRVLQRLHG